MRGARLLGLALVLGCSGVRPPAPARVDLPPPDPGASFVTPARWDYHPPAPSTALAALKAPDGGCAFTAEGGQRWSAATMKQVGNLAICAGKAEASAVVAPEELTSLVRRADGSWLYVGEGGTLYLANEALGAFARTVPAPEPLGKAADAGEAVLAVTQEGKLLRWESAKGWRPASTSPALAGARIFDLAVAGKRVLALGFPEALLISEDEGATWAAAAAPTVGARRLGATPGGDLAAQGLFESVVWRGATFTRGPEKIPASQATLELEVGRAPSAAAVQAGRAVLDGDRYYEVVRPENEGEIWLMARGRIEGRLETVPIAGSERCGNLRLGARGKVVFLACVSADGAEIAADLRRSTDAATTWGEPLRLVTPDTDQITLAVAADGSLMITGVCRALDAGSTCKPAAPLVLREATPDAGAGDAGSPRLHAAPSNAPQLSGMAVNPVFSADGHVAYFLGKRGKDDRITLFVSHDGGESFSPRTLQVTSGSTPAHRREGEDDAPEGDGPDTFEIDEASPLHPGDDGTIGMMVTRQRGGPAYVTVDDDGRLLQVSGPPLDDDGNAVDVLLAGYGRRVLAIPSYVPEGSSGAYWESLDGGANWDRQGLPQALVREYVRGSNMALTCAFAGCVIGDTVSRVGWGGAAEAAAENRTPDPGQGGNQSVLTPIVCELSAGTRWSRIEDVYVPRSGSPLPTVHDLMRGRAVWSVLTHDRATGALASATALLPESGEGEARVVRRPLMGARSPHTATAISASQVEGYAVVRAPYPVDAKGKPRVGAPLRDVEVAWENLFEGTTVHARIPDAGPLEHDDVIQTADGLDLLQTGMISVTSHGLFVRVHLGQAKSGQEVFIDASGRVERHPSTPWPSSTAVGPADFRADAAALAGEQLGVGLLRSGELDWSAVVLAKRAPGGATWTYTADSLLPPPGPAGSSLVFTTWAWSAKAPVGVLAVVADPPHMHAWAHFVGFRGDGTFLPAQPVPTLYDLGERPRPCTLADRTGTARSPVPFRTLGRVVLFPGARHPVLVQEPRTKNAVGIAEPLVLLTSSAVVQGTPASPCLAGFEVESATSAPISAVVPGDLAHAWLFRSSVDPPRAGKRPDAAPTPTLEYRPMVCHYDPAARVPEIVWTRDGTSRP
jgi:hypothetical protein